MNSEVFLLQTLLRVFGALVFMGLLFWLGMKMKKRSKGDMK